MGKTLMHSKSFREAEKQSNQHQRSLLESLHRLASEALAHGCVGEYVEDIPDWPWFAVVLGDLELTVSYYPTDESYVIRTSDFRLILSVPAERGTAPVWACLDSLRGGTQALCPREGV